MGRAKGSWPNSQIIRSSNSRVQSWQKKALPEFHRCADVLNGHLKGRNWLTGANLTVADFAVGSAMAMAVPAQYPMAGYGEITRWYGALAALPAWKKSLVAPPPA